MGGPAAPARCPGYFPDMKRARLIAGAALLAPLALLAPRLAAQTGEVVIAVLPFENAGSYGRDRENFDALKKGLAELTISELAGVGGMRVRPRAEVQRVMDQQGLAPERLDRQTVARIGQLAGAGYVVAGSFVDVFGDFRIDVRLLNTQSGEIVKVVRSDPALHDRQDMYRMLQSAVAALTGGPPLAAPITPRARSIPTEALTQFSLGLLHADRGDRVKARELLQKALALAPDFAEARAALAP